MSISDESGQLKSTVSYLQNFPTLPLEFLLQELSPKGVRDLTNTCKSLRNNFLQEKWMIFGRHVFQIEVTSNKLTIQKLERGKKIASDELESIEEFQEFSRKISSVDRLVLDVGSWITIGERKEVKRLLLQLGTVHELELKITTMKNMESFTRFLCKLPNITDLCVLRMDRPYDDRKTFDDPSKQNLQAFFANQLQNCEQINFWSHVSYDLEYSDLNFLYALLTTTNVKKIEFSDANVEFLQSIIENGIPSQNANASILIEKFVNPHELIGKAMISLPQTHLDEDGGRLIQMEQAIDIVLDRNTQPRCYRRLLDENRECVYVLTQINRNNYYKTFIAKYFPREPLHHFQLFNPDDSIQSGLNRMIFSKLNPVGIKHLMKSCRSARDFCLRNSSIVFGNHLENVSIDMKEGKVMIKKFAFSMINSFKLSEFSPLMRKVSSCRNFHLVSLFEIDDMKKDLLISSIPNCIKFCQLELSAIVKLSVWHSEWISEKLKDCQEFDVKALEGQSARLIPSVNGYSLYQRALSMTSAEKFAFPTADFQSVKSIVQDGIPGCHPFKSIFFNSFEQLPKLYTYFPERTETKELEEIDKEKHKIVYEMMRDCFKGLANVDKMIFGTCYSAYRQKIDPSIECIYLIDWNNKFFFAKQVPMSSI